MSYEAAVHAQAIELGKMSLEMTAIAGAGHPSTALSLAHITTVLMFSQMRWSPDYPDYPTSDRLVLSEGHAVPVVYCAAIKLGVMIGKDAENRRRLTMDDLKTLRAADSMLDGHPNPMEGFPFFDAATGSLGGGGPGRGGAPGRVRQARVLHHRRRREPRGADRRGARLHRRSQTDERPADLQLQRVRASSLMLTQALTSLLRVFLKF